MLSIARIMTWGRLLPALLWIAAAGIEVALSLRFAMRALGVRDDIPFPGLIYSLTAPLVRPFYRWFPAEARFDVSALEVASLVAAGVAVAAALVIYVAGLLASGVGRGVERDVAHTANVSP